MLVKKIRFMSMRYCYAAICMLLPVDVHLHPFLCYCKNSVVASRDVGNACSQLSRMPFCSLLCAAGPEVQNRVCGAKLHLFSAAITEAVQVFNTNQLAI